MNSSLSLLVVGPASVAFLAIAGCSHSSPPPNAPPPVSRIEVTVATPAPSPPDAPPQAVTIRVAEDLRKACSIDDSNTDATTLFRFDSSSLSSGDRRLLEQLAQCLTTGPLTGRVLSLVGRADPRGSEEYNQALGDRRAGSVQSYLQDRGMDSANVHASSRGALDAVGTDEDSWQQDRRVDVALAL
jgi:peptidoglycan-associated lipoprotein